MLRGSRIARQAKTSRLAPLTLALAACGASGRRYAVVVQHHRVAGLDVGGHRLEGNRQAIEIGEGQ
jgi:hypothetical protein